MDLSYSKIGDFKKCPYAFKRVHIDKDVEEKPSYYLRYGSFVHKVLEEFGEIIRENNNAYPDNINEEVKELWKKYSKSYGISDKYSLDESKRIIHDFSKQMRGWDGFEILSNEMSFKLELEGVTKFQVRGKIDQIVKLGKTYNVRDYKTSSTDKYLLKDPLQLQIYAIAAVENLELSPKDVKCSFVMLKDGCRETKPMSFTHDKLGDVKRYLVAISNEIESRISSDDFPQKVGGLCPYCPVLSTCSAALATPFVMKKYGELKAEGKV